MSPNTGKGAGRSEKSSLGEITYKPGYTITVKPCPSGQARLIVIRADVPDSLDPLKQITLQMSARIENSRDNDYFKPALIQLVRDFEFHELNEWLKIDGVQVTKPHP